MIEKLISFQVAVLAEEEGFNIKTEQYYSSNTRATSPSYNEFAAPTQSLLQKWLRERWNIKVTVNSSTLNGNKKWVDWYVSVDGKQIIDHRDGLDSYEEALEIGLTVGLGLIK
jgi:hypothetical protein